MQIFSVVGCNKSHLVLLGLALQSDELKTKFFLKPIRLLENVLIQKTLVLLSLTFFWKWEESLLVKITQQFLK